MGEEIASAMFGLIMGLWAILHSGSLERDRKRRLTKMLNNPRWTWRSFSWLAANIAADKETARRLLVAVGARPQVRNPNKWGLISKVGEP